ncbi:hypothetical protein [Methanoculleus receptaculi]|uniref:Uncharacterized protein n=1 Tax=Methanoculleus receptaculi TaxID=394967 RepID=A0AAX4FVR2_9EURY|nr:hypothetical protein [Methanoculleus receptaculi]WOX57959.1 hypothetical protein R6Y96_01495 [Methanoculleus receptaculi]
MIPCRPSAAKMMHALTCPPTKAAALANGFQKQAVQVRGRICTERRRMATLRGAFPFPARKSAL